jgi:hypothetical protein
MPALGHTVTEDAVRAAQQSMALHEFERAYLNRWTTALGDPVIRSMPGKPSALSEKYTAEEIQKPGEEGTAHKKLSGSGFHYPVKHREDLLNAVQAIGRSKPHERPSIVRFIRKRAAELEATSVLPASWKEP